MANIAGVIAVLACTLFAGAAIYVSLVEHPARMSCGIEVALREFAPSYKRGTIMQVSLAVTATLAGFSVWMDTGQLVWLWGSILIFSVIPFTLIAILPTNKRLLAHQAGEAADETRRLLELWGRLHAVRSIIGVIASGLFAVSGR
jgi:hypothetical protein